MTAPGPGGPDFRTYDAYGREITPPDARARLREQDRARRAAALDPDDLVTVSCGLHALAVRTDVLAAQAGGLDRPDLVQALAGLADDLRDAGGKFAGLAGAEEHRRSG